MTESEAIDILESAIGKPILLRPTVKLRQQLEIEAGERRRSLNNLVIIILERYFKTKRAK